MITIKSAREVETMAAAGRILADTLALIAGHVAPGVSTRDLDRTSSAATRARGRRSRGCTISRRRCALRSTTR